MITTTCLSEDVGPTVLFSLADLFLSEGRGTAFCPIAVFLAVYYGLLEILDDLHVAAWKFLSDGNFRQSRWKYDGALKVRRTALTYLLSVYDILAGDHVYHFGIRVIVPREMKVP